VFLIFETRTKGNRKQSKIFLDFSNIQTKRNNGNIFGLFVFWKVGIRMRTLEKAKHGYT
jgi:hypothetical protein